MKQFTTPEQTTKLIELGLPKPKGLADAEPSSGKWVREVYSIGELIEMLPEIHPLYHDPYCLDIGFDTISWVVGYTYNDGYVEKLSAYELIDAFFDMVVKLKEEGTI